MMGKFTMKGLCYSALSYALLFIGKTAIVIGDDGLALRSTGELATVANQVYLICTGNQVLVSPLWLKLQTAMNVTTLNGHQVIKVKGDQFARSPVTKEPSGRIAEYKADGIFVEKALKPLSDMVRYLVELDESGRILVDCANYTNLPGLFAAGDVTNSYVEQVLVFCAHVNGSATRYEERGMELYCVQDATIASALAMLAAPSLGLATVWVGAFDEDEVQRITSAPQAHRPVAMLPMGYAAESPRIRSRRRLSDLIHQIQ
jgi:nitroreductase family protein/pyridine nucleotide-disulfide oxidoreductase